MADRDGGGDGGGVDLRGRGERAGEATTLDASGGTGARDGGWVGVERGGGFEDAIDVRGVAAGFREDGSRGGWR